MMPQFRIQDILDILIMSILIYQLYSWFRKSRAIQVLAGLGTLTVIYFLTRQAGLHMTSWVLQQLGTVILIVIVVVFQHEIRQTLYRFSRLKELVGVDQQAETRVPPAIPEAAFSLAQEHCGALIVFQRTDALDDHITHGVVLDALVSAPLLTSIFKDKTPLHDGAVLIRDGRIVQAACLLPLSDSQRLPQHLGTRHRAALGLSERSDAVILVISEERGTVSLIHNGEIFPISNETQLIHSLEQLLFPDGIGPRPSLGRRIISNLTVKIAVVGCVTAIWLLLSLRQGEIAMVTVPLTFKDIPSGMAIQHVYPEEVTVRVRSTSGLAPSPRQLELTAEVPLTTSIEGANTIRITSSQVRVPSGISIVGIDPGAVRVTIKRATKRFH